MVIYAKFKWVAEILILDYMLCCFEYTSFQKVTFCIFYTLRNHEHFTFSKSIIS